MQSFVVSMQTISHVLSGDEVVQCIEGKVDERLEQNDGLIGQMNQLIKTLRYECDVLVSKLVLPPYNQFTSV